MSSNFDPGEAESFESWFKRLPMNDELMSLIYTLYQFDQYGKQNQERLIAKLLVRRQITPMTDNQIDKLNELIKFDLIDDVLALRHKKSH